MLAKLGNEAFDDEDWLFEIKWDGYRGIADLSDDNYQFYSRNGVSYLNKFESIVTEFSVQKYPMILDGEIVAYDEKGYPNFQLLQQIGKNPNLNIIYHVFDLLWLNGYSTKELTLWERKELLKDALIETDRIKFSDHILKNGKDFFEQIKRMQLEGMIAKKRDSVYLENYRSNDWLKIKITNTEDVIICGYTAPRGSRRYFGSLILGKYKNAELMYTGHAGTGFNESKLKEIHQLLQDLITESSPFDEEPPTNAESTWVEPKIVCEIKYSEITEDGIFRHPVFLHLRPDKKATEIFENSNSHKIMKENAKTEREDNLEVKINRHKVKLTNQNKIYFPKSNITKGDVVDYYQSISEYILDHLKDRPLSLNRFPNGIDESNFYHKDAGENTPKWVKTTEVYSESSDKTIDYILCNNQATLAYLNNLGCIDINPWNSQVPKLDNPDYLVLDIDPSEKNTFDEVIETALQIKAIVDEIKIDAYCKTSGSTGIHIYIPMEKKYTYDQVKDFAHILMKKTHEKLPKITTLERSLKKRAKNEIYLDYLQNRRSQTLASVYSLRPREGASVSMPLEWSELKNGIKPTDFTIFNAFERIQSKGDIFKPVLEKGIDMMEALEKLSV